MEDAPRKRRGRPRSGRLFPHKVFGYVTDEELELLGRLADKTNGSGKPRGAAAVIRAGIRALAEKEGQK